MSAWRSSMHGIAQEGRGWGVDIPGEGCGAIPRRSKSKLAGVGFIGKAGSGIRLIMISRRIVEIRVLSAYSNEVILINPPCFLD